MTNRILLFRSIEFMPPVWLSLSMENSESLPPKDGRRTYLKQLDRQREDQSKQQTVLRQTHLSAEILLRIKAIDDWIQTVLIVASRGIKGTSCRNGRKISVRMRGG